MDYTYVLIIWLTVEVETESEGLQRSSLFEQPRLTEFEKLLGSPFQITVNSFYLVFLLELVIYVTIWQEHWLLERLFATHLVISPPFFDIDDRMELSVVNIVYLFRYILVYVASDLRIPVLRRHVGFGWAYFMISLEMGLELFQPVKLKFTSGLNTLVRSCLGVPSFVLHPIAVGSEAHWAVPAPKRLFASVNALVHLQVGEAIEFLSAYPWILPIDLAILIEDLSEAQAFFVGENALEFLPIRAQKRVNNDSTNILFWSEWIWSDTYPFITYFTPLMLIYFLGIV